MAQLGACDLDPTSTRLHERASLTSELGHFGLERSAMVRGGGQLDEQGGATGIGQDLPPGAKRFRRAEQSLS